MLPGRGGICAIGTSLSEPDESDDNAAPSNFALLVLPVKDSTESAPIGEPPSGCSEISLVRGGGASKVTARSASGRLDVSFLVIDFL